MRSPASELPLDTSIGGQTSAISSIRAIAIGVAVIVGGSLVMTTIIGTVAIIGMILRHDTGPTIVSQLTGSFELVLLCAMGGWLMNIIGGYIAGMNAGQHWIGHGFWAGTFAAPLSLAVIALLGDTGPLWLTVTSMVLIVPCATLGGWLASPAQDRTSGSRTAPRRKHCEGACLQPANTSFSILAVAESWSNSAGSFSIALRLRPTAANGLRQICGAMPRRDLKLAAIVVRDQARNAAGGSLRNRCLKHGRLVLNKSNLSSS